MHRTMKTAPCQDCPDREPECHADCERYAEWRRLHDKGKAQEKKNRAVVWEHDNYLIEREKRVRRKT